MIAVKSNFTNSFKRGVVWQYICQNGVLRRKIQGTPTKPGRIHSSMACGWQAVRPAVGEWIPTKVQVTQDVDDEGRKIFEAFYGMPLRPLISNILSTSRLNRVFGVTNDIAARTNAELAVVEFNKKKKKENQPPLQFLKVVGAIRIPRLLKDTYYLITLQALDGSTEPRKFFAKVIEHDCYDCETKHIKLDEWLRVDDDLTQLKHPLFKIRREEKWFLKELEAEVEKKKSLFLSKISSALDVSHAKGKRQILEVVSSDLRKLTQFKEPNGPEFEGEESFVLLQEDEGGESSEMQHAIVDGSKVNSSIAGPSSSSNRYDGFGYSYANLTEDEKECMFSGMIY